MMLLKGLDQIVHIIFKLKSCIRLKIESWFTWPSYLPVLENKDLYTYSYITQDLTCKDTINGFSVYRKGTFCLSEFQAKVEYYPYHMLTEFLLGTFDISDFQFLNLKNEDKFIKF